MSAVDVVVALAVGLLAGAFAGLLGVGGGIIMVPAMVLFLDVSQHVAQGTSLLVIVPTALVGTVANARRAHLERSSALVLAVAGIAGAVGGALISVQLDERILRKIFGVFLLLMSLRLLLRSDAAEVAPREE